MKIFLALALLASGAICAPALAATDVTKNSAAVIDLGGGSYSFTLGGFSNGATVTGSFTGAGGPGLQITNYGNGNLLTAFSASFSGNATVGAFTLGLGNVMGFVYTIGNTNWGTDTSGQVEGFAGMSSGGDQFLFGPGPASLCDQGVDCGSVSGTGTTVPEPAMWAMMVTGFGLVGAAVRRRRTAGAVQA